MRNCTAGGGRWGNEGGARGGGEKSIDEYAAAAPETIQRGSYSEGYSFGNAARWPVIIAENKHSWLRCNPRLTVPRRERLHGQKIRTSAGDVMAFYTYKYREKREGREFGAPP